MYKGNAQRKFCNIDHPPAPTNAHPAHPTPKYTKESVQEKVVAHALFEFIWNRKQAEQQGKREVNSFPFHFLWGCNAKQWCIWLFNNGTDLSRLSGLLPVVLDRAIGQVHLFLGWMVLSGSPCDSCWTYRACGISTLMKVPSGAFRNSNPGWVWRRIPIIPEFWETKARGLLEARRLKPAWAT